MTARLDYVELPVGDSEASARFFADAFGWSLTSFGPSYSATTTGDVDVGLQADRKEASAAPLPVVRVDDLEACRSAVVAAGGVVVRDIFAFPGGRRFHFREPGGNELAAWTT
ncbi:MAG: VOC family protein [Sphingomonadales bacterium]